MAKIKVRVKKDSPAADIIKAAKKEIIMTAVNWLEKELKDRYSLMNSEPFFEQAKQMEKEQIVKAGNSCGLKSKLYDERIKDMSTDELGIEIDKPSITFGEEYYNETYGKE